MKALGLMAGVVALSATGHAGKVAPSSNATFRESFIENRGQWDAEAKYLLRTAGIDTWVVEDGVVYDFYRMSGTFDFRNAKRINTSLKRSGHVVKMDFLNSKTASMSGVQPLPGKAGYIPAGSRTATVAPVFAEAKMHSVYPGISTRLYVDEGSPRFDLIVAPGADPSQIQVRFEGASNVRSVNGSDLRFDTNLGTKVVGQLFAYQTVNGVQRQVPCQFNVGPDGTVRYLVGQYDPTRALVIDPVVYSTLIGGFGSADSVNSIAVDSLTSAYVTGSADAATFPTTPGAYDETPVSQEAFVSKFLPDGSDLAYSTFVGGSLADVGADIAVDAEGNAYVVGTTNSADFDTTPGAFQAAPANGVDMFVIKLNPTGSALVYSTLLGGGGDDFGSSIAIDQDGAAYVSGVAGANTFPFANAQQAWVGPNTDAVVACLNATGTGLTYSTPVGGNDTFDPGINEDAVGVAVDVDKNAFIAVITDAPDAWTPVGAFDRTANGTDVYVASFNPSGNRNWATFVGGNSIDQVSGIALDRTSNVYITGVTLSFNYPRTATAFDRSYNLFLDAFCTKINRLGTGLLWSTFLGTQGGLSPLGAPIGAFPTSIAVDDIGFAHITGFITQSVTNAQWLTVTANADDPTFNGPANGSDAFLIVMNDSGTGLQYSGYLGGGDGDGANAIALDGARNAYLGGSTTSVVSRGAFPTTPGAFKEDFRQDANPNPLPDGFVTKIKTRIPLTISSLVINPNSVASGQSTTGTVTISAAASSGGATISISNNNNSVVTTPPTAFIPEGATTATFNIDTTANLTTTQVVNVTATVEGDSKSATLTVNPWLVALTLSNDTVVGGNLVGGRVTVFAPAPGQGIAINLNSTVPTVASVPSVVTVPTGLTTATFDVTTRGVVASQFVDITASYAGLTRTVTLQVIPSRLVSLSFIPTVVSGGTPVQGKVQLNGAAPDSGYVVNLVSSNVALTVPATVAIAAQTNSATFNGTTDVVNVDTSVTVTATLGLDSVQAVVDVLRANLISLAVVPDVIQGGNTALGTVGLDAPAATGGVTVPISSSNPSVASVPATVIIPSGSTNTNFNVVTSLVATDTTVTITATRGSVTLNVDILVKRVEFSLTLAPSTVTGGQSSVATLTLLQAAPTGGITVNLSTSNTSVATVPSTIQIPAGETVGTFTVNTVSVASDTTVDVIAGFGTATNQATLTVNAARPITLTLNPTSVSGGGSSTGRVTLSGAAPAGGVVVTLSSNVAQATVPATVTVAQNATQATFAVNTTAVTTTTVATISATANGDTVTADLTIVAAKLLQIRFVPSRVRGGQTTTMIITLDAAAPTGGAVINLTNSNPNVATIPASVTINAGQTSAGFTVLTRRVSRTLATQVTATYNGDSRFAILTATR